ncbi:phosphoadenosine phosphosulfate reductase family protein [Nitrosovibrio sp. Nv6]|uniref:phosphoadenosine phosphosulfate reductase family protein n=1 Tax=Nitrosovibrio sp. Nv6 TaxID=1855340 RepID=UPI0008CD7E5B|nr:phosphoadenosine phosphosulfate reductase family protein [Nitrosovibrio sp. Nv6]SEO65876.1 Phosphoadenosine phosphosulfate reductase family protein [Nitrosovibrio sp. Nv6]
MMLNKKIRHVVSISGGKDSTATLELALSNCPRESIIPIFCDTGNEHEAVDEYLGYLEKMCAIRVMRLKADFSEQIAAKRMFIARDQRTRRDNNGRRVRWSNKAKRRALSVLHPTGNPFLDLCLWKGRFPSRKAQFCTKELKRNMAVEFQLNLIDKGFSVLSWQGVRRDESLNRRDAKKIERVGPRLWVFRPIIDWTALDVFEYCAKRGLDHNPLYKQGMKRVGCMPCINVNKGELRQIAVRFPEHISRIAGWEKLVSAASKRQVSTFFAAYKDPTVEIGDVHKIVEWAQTSRGGRQYDLLGGLSDTSACASAYGLCE